MTATGTFIFICSACGYKARLPEEFSGKTIKCPGCQATQLAKAQVNTERKTASFTRVAATPMPFTLPKEQEDALAQSATVVPQVAVAIPVAAVPAAQPTTAKSFPSPLPGAIQVTSDRIAKAAAAKPTTAATIDFGCSSCHARMRLPAHYEGKSILCPKCSAPQKVFTTLPEPMDTTRAVVREGDRPAQVRVTPLPRTYPTPLPTAAPELSLAAIAPVMGQPTKPHIGELSSIKNITSFPSKTPSPEQSASVAPAADALAGMTMAISALARESASTATHAADAGFGSSTGEFAKPHPSRGKIATVAVRKSTGAPETPAAPVQTPTQGAARPATAAYAKSQRSPLGLIVALGVLGLLVIGLGAAAVSWKLSLNEALAGQKTAEAAASSAAQREQAATAKIKYLTAQIEALEIQVKSAPVSGTDGSAAETDSSAAETDGSAAETDGSGPTPDAAVPAPNAPDLPDAAKPDSEPVSTEMPPETPVVVPATP